MSEEDKYLADSINECVEHTMKQSDEAKRRILTGLFQYIDRLINEDILVKALNDKEKQDWFNNEYCKIANELQQKIDKAIEYIKGMPDEEEYNGLLYDNEEKRDLLEILGDKENE